MGDIFGRIPFVTLVAAIVCCLGVGLFCGTLYRALDITIHRLFEGLFHYHVPRLEAIQIAFIVIAVVMGAYAIMLLVFGFLATGATRENLYSGVKCIMGGRISVALFLAVSWILNGIWFFITCVCAMTIIIYVMLDNICAEEIENKQLWYYESYCLNLSRFGIYMNYSDGVDKNALCDDTELNLFCQHITDAGPMYALALCGSLLIVLGMAVFLIVLSSNYQRIVSSKMVTEFREAVEMELNESRDELAMAAASPPQTFLNTSLSGGTGTGTGSYKSGKALIHRTGSYSHADF